jgi:4-hydroxybenzoate polyprenyltransferase
MGEGIFFMLVLSTVCITAAGNAINDYHDVSADRLNHPDKVVIDKFIGRRAVIILHFILSSLGVLLGLFVSLYHHIYWMIPVILIIPVLLWLYSTIYKHKLLVGNLLISLLTGMVPLLVVLYEYPLLLRANRDVLEQFPDLFRPVLYWVGLFSLFAFLTNLILEIIKDAAEFRGDREVGSRTLAVVFGRKVSKITAGVLSLITLAGLATVFLLFLRDWLSLVYFALFLLVPWILLIVQLFRAEEQKAFYQLTQLVKIIMLTGLIYAPVAFIVMKMLLT